MSWVFGRLWLYWFGLNQSSISLSQSEVNVVTDCLSLSSLSLIVSLSRLWRQWQCASKFLITAWDALDENTDLHCRALCPHLHQVNVYNTHTHLFRWDPCNGVSVMSARHWTKHHIHFTYIPSSDAAIAGPDWTSNLEVNESTVSPPDLHLLITHTRAVTNILGLLLGCFHQDKNQMTWVWSILGEILFLYKKCTLGPVSLNTMETSSSILFPSSEVPMFVPPVSSLCPGISCLSAYSQIMLTTPSPGFLLQHAQPAPHIIAPVFEPLSPHSLALTCYGAYCLGQ